MQFQSRAIVTGSKFFKDRIDGQDFDQCTIFVQMNLDESKGNAKGFATQAMQWGEAANYDKIKSIPFPFEAELTIQMVTSGKVQKQQVVGLKPLTPAKASVAG